MSLHLALARKFHARVRENPSAIPKPAHHFLSSNSIFIPASVKI